LIEQQNGGGIEAKMEREIVHQAQKLSVGDLKNWLWGDGTKGHQHGRKCERSD
jgi:hypothetical protein